MCVCVFVDVKLLSCMLLFEICLSIGTSKHHHPLRVPASSLEFGFENEALQDCFTCLSCEVIV